MAAIRGLRHFFTSISAPVASAWRSIRPADLRKYYSARVDWRGSNGCSDRVTFNGLANASWIAPTTVTPEWKTVEVPFAALQPESKRHAIARSGTDVTQVEIGGSCPGGQKLWLQTDNWRFY